MRFFESADEAESLVGRAYVSVGTDRGILKAVERAEPVATVSLDRGGEIRLPLKWLVLEAAKEDDERT